MIWNVDAKRLLAGALVWMCALSALPARAASADAKGNGADAKLGHGVTVLLDAWFNSQKRKGADGKEEYFHYKWNDTTNSGYSLLGEMIRSFGAKTDTLYTAPTAEALDKAQIYMIVSPDMPIRNPNPHYMTAADAETIAAWVKRGGVLLMMENDPVNADISHMDLLGDKFGIHFNDVFRNRVEDDHIEQGRILIPGGGEIFHSPHTIYMKEICTMTLTGPAKPALVSDGFAIMAVAHYGKGTVFATVDPWLYNEYTNGKNLPPSYDNMNAGGEWMRWVLKQVKH